MTLVGSEEETDRIATHKYRERREYGARVRSSATQHRDEARFGVGERVTRPGTEVLSLLEGSDNKRKCGSEPLARVLHSCLCRRREKGERG